MDQTKIDEAQQVLMQADKEGLSLRKLSKRTTLPYSTLKEFSRGVYKGRKSAIAQRVINHVVPLLKRWPPKPRKAKPPQFKGLAPQLHAQLKPLYRAWGPEIVSRWYCVTADELSKFMRGTAKGGVAEFIATVERIGIPTPPICCRHCGGEL